MLVDVRVFADPRVLGFGLIYAVLAIAAKVVGCALPAYFMNFNILGSLRIGTGMIPRGEVALIIAGIGSATMMTVNGSKVPVINSELFGLCIIMTLLTTVAAPPLLSAILGIKKKGVRKEVQDTGSVHTVYTLSSETIRDFVIRVMQENFRRDGFRHSNMVHDGGIVSFRRGSVVFSLTIENNVLDFESDAAEAVLIKTIMYETFVEIHQTMEELKNLASPENFGSVVAVEDTPDAEKRPEIKLENIIPSSAVIVEIESKDYIPALKEIINRLAESHLLKDADLCCEDVLKRESAISTCIPGGIALPHGRTAGVSRLISAVAVSRDGVPNGNGDDRTKIFVLTLSPLNLDQPYLQYISHIGKLLSREDNIRDALAARTPEELRNIFVGRV